MSIKNYGVLIVDDEEVQRKILIEYLQFAGFVTFEAEDGQAALDFLKKKKPELILLDVQMPVLDGFKTLEAIKHNPELIDIPVILLTNMDQRPQKIKGLELGADDYITKPFDHAELLARINAALRRTERYRRVEGVLEGDLENINIVDLLQNLILSSKTATIRVDELDGEILVKNGMTMHVRQGGFINDQALIRMLLMERGFFSVKFGEVSRENADSFEPMMAMLMDALSKVDEINDIVFKTKLGNQPVILDPDVTEFPQLEKIKDKTPATFLDLLVMMEDSIEENLKTLIRASKKGKLLRTIGPAQ